MEYRKSAAHFERLSVKRQCDRDDDDDEVEDDEDSNNVNKRR